MFQYIISIDSSDRSVIIRCPATILADKRTAKVIGRIKFLTVSINTIKFISLIGVPIGVMCATILLKELQNPKIRIDTHRVKDRLKVIVVCAIVVKLYGINDIIFMVIITKNLLFSVSEEYFLSFFPMVFFVP